MPSIIFGLIAMALGLWGLSAWWYSAVEALRGLMPLVLILVGLVALGAGITSVRLPGRPGSSDYRAPVDDNDE